MTRVVVVKAMEARLKPDRAKVTARKATPRARSSSLSVGAGEERRNLATTRAVPTEASHMPSIMITTRLRVHLRRSTGWGLGRGGLGESPSPGGAGSHCAVPMIGHSGRLRGRVGAKAETEPPPRKGDGPWT